MRLFLAIPLPESHREVLGRIQNDLGAGRIVDPDLLHLTLVFLGDRVSDEAAENLHMALDGARLIAPKIEIQGAGHFGRETPRALWVGVAPNPALTALQSKLERRARDAGCDAPRRRFAPHITLARVRGLGLGMSETGRFVQRHAALRLPVFTPSGIQLMRSHLGRSGADYEPLATYPLQAPQASG
ncbi:MAG: RNA 2',3'-cyclic phosphodiesterase [Paracoccaceae bacterium]|nr:RNA 2',3'-cyclic phosphodiesterase [Paracoccaceae bacterium]